MSTAGAAPCAAVPAINAARAEASRRNGAKSRGPKSPKGEVRSAQNALRHGLRPQKHIVLPGEDAAEFAALEAALLEELAPEGALQSVLVQRVASTVWRLSRAERLEAELLAHNHLPGGSLALALIRDCNGARSFDTLLRYRGGFQRTGERARNSDRTRSPPDSSRNVGSVAAKPPESIAQVRRGDCRHLLVSIADRASLPRIVALPARRADAAGLAGDV